MFVKITAALIRIIPVTLSFVFLASHTGGALTRFQKVECRKWHNYYRLMHQVQRVSYSTALEKKAIKWANYLARNNKFQHESGNAGNLYATMTKASNPCRVAVTAFYSEEKYYNYKKPGWSARTGHFTQVVWKSTKYIGAAWVQRRDKKWWILVIKYSPLGNVGRYAQNVFPHPVTTAKPPLTTRSAVGYNNTDGLTAGTNTTRAVGVIRAGATPPPRFYLSRHAVVVMAGVFVILFL